MASCALADAAHATPSVPPATAGAVGQGEPTHARVLVPPDARFSFSEPHVYPSFAWAALQLLPSPEVVVGRRESGGGTDATFGLRWQLTPMVWSWGTHRRISPWRWFVVDPLARHSGSLELEGTFELLFGQIDRWIVRPGVRAYLPVAQRGEYLSVSFGTSAYTYDDKLRVAYDIGAYVLYGLLGVQITVAPEHGPMSTIGTIRIRYF